MGADDSLGGGRPLRESDASSRRPVGFDLGWQCSGNRESQRGNDGAMSSRIPNSDAEREPSVQARGRSPPRMESGSRGPFEMLRHKELEKVDVPLFPEITKFMIWKSTLARAVAIAANNPDMQSVMQWIHAAWAED